MPQRRLGALKIVCATSAVLMLAATPTAAMAEVCDKVVGEAWRPGDAPALAMASTPIWRFALPVAVWVLTLEVVVVAAIGILSAGRLVRGRANLVRICCIGAAAYLTILACIVFVGRVSPDEVVVGALREGCVTLRTYWLDLIVTVAIAILFGWAAYRVRSGGLPPSAATNLTG